MKKIVITGASHLSLTSDSQTLCFFKIICKSIINNSKNYYNAQYIKKKYIKKRILLCTWYISSIDAR